MPEKSVNGTPLNPRPYFPPPMTKKLVQLVTEHECLVNHYDNTYMGRCKRMEAWKQITNILNQEFGLNFTVKQIKKKFFNIEQNTKNKVYPGGNGLPHGVGRPVKRESSVMTGGADDETGEDVIPTKLPAMTETEGEYLKLFNNKWRNKHGGKINSIASKLKKNNSNKNDNNIQVPKTEETPTTPNSNDIQMSNIVAVLSQMQENSQLANDYINTYSDRDQLTKILQSFQLNSSGIQHNSLLNNQFVDQVPNISSNGELDALNYKPANHLFDTFQAFQQSSEANNNIMGNLKKEQDTTLNITAESASINSVVSNTTPARNAQTPSIMSESPNQDVVEINKKYFETIIDKIEKMLNNFIDHQNKMTILLDKILQKLDS
ncbi:MADF domain-containing protein [Strongyloides ratti]|uniref:MADF domain-containing protein n=1 Tax=Strongyloides ratti TaxID=34506 RepID=A0A090LDP7_STRRB|nr:MADF domain-containing protein [Strongyloides ratti]CEF66238.1 MADF domain-containing protein [Strongyloides ratti]